MDIVVAIVTYSDRRSLLYKVIDGLQNQSSISRIVIHLNGVSDCVKNDIIQYSKSINKPVFFTESVENLGSAGGFNFVMQYVNNSFNDYSHLLLLDDDNLLPQDCCSILNDSNVNDQDIYFLYREDRPILLKAKISNKPFLPIGTANSFLGRDVTAGVFDKHIVVNSDLVVAPYSGLLLPKIVLDNKIYPFIDFYLYADDYEYTYRLVTKHNYRINLLEGIKIVDLESSFHLKNKRFNLLSNRYIDAPDFRVFYSVRNQVFLSKNRITCIPVFILNMSFVSIYILLGLLFRFKIKKSFIFVGAVVKGLIFSVRE